MGITGGGLKMPIYEFACDNKECDNYEKVIEIRTSSFYNGEDFYCEKCNSPMQKLVSLFGFELIGNGFHRNDYPS